MFRTFKFKKLLRRNDFLKCAELRNTRNKKHQMYIGNYFQKNPEVY